MLLMAAMTAKAQFSLSPHGIVDGHGHNYVVVQYKGMNRSSISSMIASNLRKSFISNDDKLEQNDSTIIVSGRKNNCISDKAVVAFAGARHIAYKFVIDIRDGRARVRPTEVFLSSFAEKSYPNFTTTNWTNVVTFKKDGSVRNKTTASSLEAFLNNFVKIISSPQKESEW